MNPRLFNVTFVNNDIILTSNSLNEVRNLLQFWQSRHRQPSLLIHCTNGEHNLNFENFEKEESENQLSVSHVLLSDTMERVVSCEFPPSFMAVSKAFQKLEIISADFCDYETYIWAWRVAKEDHPLLY